MDKKIFDIMLNLLVELDNYDRWTHHDFQIDLDSLKSYEGEFLWFIGSSGTHLMKIEPGYIADMMGDEQFRYAFAQRALSNDYIPEQNCCKIVSFKADGAFMFVSPEYARKMWAERRERAIAIYKERTGKELPTDFKIRVEFGCGMEYVIEQLRYAAQNNDNSLIRCLNGFRKHMKRADDHKIVIYKDFAERSFTFCEKVGGESRMAGGIIFHGYPKEGYKQNGSVMLRPSYGWSIHT